MCIHQLHNQLIPTKESQNVINQFLGSFRPRLTNYSNKIGSNVGKHMQADKLLESRNFPISNNNRKLMVK